MDILDIDADELDMDNADDVREREGLIPTLDGLDVGGAPVSEGSRRTVYDSASRTIYLALGANDITRVC